MPKLPNRDTGPARRAARIANHRRRIAKAVDILTAYGFQVIQPDDIDGHISAYLDELDSAGPIVLPMFATLAGPWDLGARTKR